MVVFSCLSASAQTETEFSIAAVVNDHVITNYNVTQRIRFIMATTGLSADQTTARNLYPRALNAIIDEELQQQEARRFNYSVTNQEVADAISVIEKESGKPEGSLLSFLSENAIDVGTLEHQIRAQLLWQKYVQQRVAPRIRVNESDVNLAVDQLHSLQEAVPEVKLASIILPVDGGDDASSKALADTVYNDLKQGLSFENIARQISSDSNMTSTSPVWVQVRELDPALAGEVRRADAPAIIPPVRIPAGYQIVMLQEKRVVDHRTNAELLFKEIVLGLSPSADEGEVDVLMTIAREVRKNPGVCGSKNIAGATELEGLDFDVHYTRTNMDDLSPQILPLVRNIGVGEISEPFATPDSIRLLKLCEKVRLPQKAMDKAPIRRKLQEEKFQIELVRLMREARNNAYIDIRR